MDRIPRSPTTSISLDQTVCDHRSTRLIDAVLVELAEERAARDAQHASGLRLVAAGGSGNDLLIGGSGTILGGSGADVLRSGGGADYLSGEAGNDRFIASGSHIVLGGGDDTVSASGNIIDAFFSFDFDMLLV